MPARRFLIHVARFYRVSRPDSEARRVLRLVGLEKHGDRRIGGFSAGMMQRLGLAQALIGHPELVMLDEPTANLDPVGRSEILELISVLSRDEGVSFLISTHVLEELERVCSEVAIMIGGVVVERGHVEELIARYGVDDYVIEAWEAERLAEKLRDTGVAREVKVSGSRVFLRRVEAGVLWRVLASACLEEDFGLLSVRPYPGVPEQIYRRCVAGAG